MCTEVTTHLLPEVRCCVQVLKSSGEDMKFKSFTSDLTSVVFMHKVQHPGSLQKSNYHNDREFNLIQFVVLAMFNFKTSPCSAATFKVKFKKR